MIGALIRLLFGKPKPAPQTVLQSRLNATLDTLNELLKEAENLGFDLSLSTSGGEIDVKVTPKPILNTRLTFKTKKDAKN